LEEIAVRKGFKAANMKQKTLFRFHGHAYLIWETAAPVIASGHHFPHGLVLTMRFTNRKLPSCVKLHASLQILLVSLVHRITCQIQDFNQI